MSIIELPSALFQGNAQSDSSPSLTPASACPPHYFLLPQVPGLSKVLRNNASFFLEIGSYDTLGKDLAILQNGAPDFGLCLTTFHTYDAQVAVILTSALNDRFGMSRLKKMHIMTCLQEALTNAVIHGNLCIPCEKGSVEAFERYYALINEALTKEHYKDMRIYIRAWDYQGSFHLSITHDGEGKLTPDIIAESHPDAEKRHGHGLFIIQSLAEQVSTDAEGKSIDVIFTY